MKSLCIGCTVKPHHKWIIYFSQHIHPQLLLGHAAQQLHAQYLLLDCQFLHNGLCATKAITWSLISFMEPYVTE